MKYQMRLLYWIIGGFRPVDRKLSEPGAPVHPLPALSHRVCHVCIKEATRFICWHFYIWIDETVLLFLLLKVETALMFTIDLQGALWRWIQWDGVSPQWAWSTHASLQRGQHIKCSQSNGFLLLMLWFVLLLYSHTNDWNFTFNVW